jgi:O-antigen/teichoic acid export membrane protein
VSSNTPTASLANSARVSTLSERLLGGGIWAFGGKIATAFIGLTANALLARLLSPSEMGAYFLALSIVLFGTMVGSLGLNRVVVRFVAESVGLDQLGRTRYVVSTVFRLGGLGALSVGLAYLLFGYILGANLLNAPDLIAVNGLVAGWMMVATLQFLMAETFRGFQDIRLATIVGGGSGMAGGLVGGLGAGILLLTCLSLLWLFKGQATLATVLLLAVCSGVVSALLAGWILYRKVAALPPRGVERAQARLDFKEMLRVGWPLLIINLTGVLLLQTDIWILSVFRSQEEVAIYGAASRLAVATLLMTWVLYAVLPPLIAEKYATGEIVILERILRAGATVTGVIAFPLLAGFVLVPGNILRIVYGDYYEGGGWILGLLSFGLFVNVVTGMRGYVLTMTGNERRQLMISVVGGFVNILGCTLGAIYWGIYGVAVAAMTAMILQCLTELIAVYSRHGIWTHASLSSVGDIKKLLAAKIRVGEVGTKRSRHF